MSTTIGVLDLVTGAFGAGVVGAFANQAPGLDQGLVARRSDLEVAAPTCGTGPGRGTRALRVGLRARGGGHPVGLAETVRYHNPSYARAEVPNRALLAWNTVVALRASKFCRRRH
ncbi:hypothetical protein [Ralstonia solanacearum]|uniref:hypothetical protein n=1 Tax=Ralstonia solanacearum TaxID=305 RepID=UPI0011AE2012|nr:hypothetical protein [Ralstonia solanacearum]